MALFILSYAYSDPALRAEHREEHLAHLNTLVDEGSVVAGGPLEDQTGGVIIFRADDEASARALVDQDPYTKHGVTKDRQLREWRVTVGSLV